MAGTRRGPTTLQRAAVLRSAGTISLQRERVPEPGPGEVRVRLEGCGVCGSSLPVWEGRDWFNYPLDAGAPGHEGWGHVDAVGDGVTTVVTGARVALLSYHAFAEYDVANADAVVRVPPSLEAQPVPAEPLGCAMNVFRRSGIRPGDCVAVIGIGFLGALLVQLARRAGARVLAVSRRPSALDAAHVCGADEIVTFDDPDSVIGRVQTLTDSALCDVVIEAAGVQAALDVAGPLVRECGRLIIAGFHQDGPRQVDMCLWNWRGVDVVNAHERDPARYVQGMREAVAAVAAGTLDPGFLYTHEYPLDRVGAALDDLRDRPAGFMKGLVRI
jgi:threonine dehydrogenase-like Zn-dependent dehydrogenase